MLDIGCHLSVSKGFLHMGKEAISIGADTFQFFTRNPQGGKAKDIDPADTEAFRKLALEHNFAKIVAHAPYTLNPCSDKPETRDFAELVFKDDLRRMEYLPGNYYNFHPGSHVGQGIEAAVKMISALLDRTLQKEQTTTVLLETMSGKGSEVGSRFEELARIISAVKLREKLGVCLDTCHVFAAGYDIVNDLDGVLAEFDRIVGLERLKAVHLNDSMTPYGSHKDRHAKIGEGFIGTAALKRLVRHPALQNLPFILETPNDLAGYKSEIALMRS